MNEKTDITFKMLEAWLDGRCTPQEALRVERWLASQNQTDEEAAWLNVIFDRIDIRDDALAERAFEKCARTLHLPDTAKPVRQKPRTWLNIAVAAAVTLAVVVTGLFGIRAINNREVAFTEVYTRRGQTETVNLPDGSRIILKAGSRLIYPEEFRGSTREVFLSGECYASIAKNPDKPFILSTGTLNIRVTGTEFNVKSFPEDSETEVALVTGSILLDSRATQSSAVQSIAMAPGNVVKVDRMSGETRITEFNAGHYSDAAAKENAYVFLNQRFADILKELERRMDVNIILMDATLGDKRFYSSFVNGESLDDMLAAFNMDDSMNIEHGTDGIIITRAKG